MSSERLQKVLSQAGLGSRREMERWIELGMVKVNDKTATIGQSVIAGDKLTVKGKLVQNPMNLSQRTRILLYHKPIGEISSRKDPKHHHTVFDNLPKMRQGRWILIGRLDINTSGLMIFTNNGELANQMMHPSMAIEREYAVRVHGQVPDDAIKNLLKGVELEDGPAKFLDIKEQPGGEGSNRWYHVVLAEGRNREVRRLWETQGVEVSRLIRVRFGQIHLPRFLSRGKTYELTNQEVNEVLKWVSPKKSIKPIKKIKQN